MIDRAKFLNFIAALEEAGAEHVSFDDLRKFIEEADTDGWIPCSERLPEFGNRYLVTALWEGRGFNRYSVYDAVYGIDGIWHTLNYLPAPYKVVAWQPLPEPYKEEVCGKSR